MNAATACGCFAHIPTACTAYHTSGAVLILPPSSVLFVIAADYQPGNALPVSASSLPIGEGFEVYTPKGGPFK
jgi:hypothetical protein